jgi:hypothetical protein
MGEARQVARTVLRVKQESPGAKTGAFLTCEALKLLRVFHFLLIVRAVTAQQRGQILRKG